MSEIPHTNTTEDPSANETERQTQSLPESLAIDPKADPDIVRHQLKGMYQSWFLEYASYPLDAHA